MKKILITILFMLAAIGAYGQNKFKYQVQALGGISIGNTADTAKIDSIILSGTLLKFYRGSQIVLINGLSTTALNNLASVAINTHLLPATSASANLGSGAKPFGKIFGTATQIESLMVGDSTSATKVTLDSLGLVDSKIASYIGADTTDPYITAGGRQELTDVAINLIDTLLVFAPVIGVGNADDTLAFTLNNVVWGVKWGGSHSLVITKVTGVVYGTTPDIDVALLYHANFRSGSGQVVFSNDLTITSTTTGDDATINASYDTIASGTWLWLRIDQATAKPTQCLISIYGYLE